MTGCSAPSSKAWCSKSQRRRFRAELVARDDDKCNWCRRALNVADDGTVIGGVPEAHPTIDHVVERRRCLPSMVRDVANMVPSCPRCNNERDQPHVVSTDCPILTAEDMTWVNDPAPANLASSVSGA